MKQQENTSQYTAIDLFSGCGGLSLGLERAGFAVKVAVEIDSAAAATYKANHPNVVVLQRDVRKVTSVELRKAAGLGNCTLDLLTGCPPCQGFSRMKNKNKPVGKDPLNVLVLHFLKIAKALRPRIVLMENVPGLAGDRRFKRMIRELRAIGYHCAWSILNAAHFGVPQRRQRLILMASRVGELEVPLDNGVRKTVRQAFRKLRKPAEATDVLQKLHQRNSPRIKKLISRIPRNGGSRSALGRRAQLECHKRLDGFKDVYGRMAWDDVAPTLTAGCFNPSKGRFLHPTQNRAITMREAAALQTFPRSYKFATKLGISTIARMIGDALPPAFAEAQGRHLVAHLSSPEAN